MSNALRNQRIAQQVATKCILHHPLHHITREGTCRVKLIHRIANGCFCDASAGQERNVHFPYQVDADTPSSIAHEMCRELQLTSPLASAVETALLIFGETTTIALALRAHHRSLTSQDTTRSLRTPALPGSEMKTQHWLASRRFDICSRTNQTKRVTRSDAPRNDTLINAPLGTFNFILKLACTTESCV